MCIRDSFTPTFKATSGNPSLNYSDRTGHYVKIGRIVHFQIRILLANPNAVVSAGSGTLYIDDLPFNPAAQAYGGASVAYFSNWVGTAPLYALMSQTHNYLYLYTGNNGGYSDPAGGGNLGNATQIRLFGSYMANA